MAVTPGSQLASPSQVAEPATGRATNGREREMLAQPRPRFGSGTSADSRRTEQRRETGVRCPVPGIPPYPTARQLEVSPSPFSLSRRHISRQAPRRSPRTPDVPTCEWGRSWRRVRATHANQQRPPSKHSRLSSTQTVRGRALATQRQALVGDYSHGRNRLGAAQSMGKELKFGCHGPVHSTRRSQVRDHP